MPDSEASDYSGSENEESEVDQKNVESDDDMSDAESDNSDDKTEKEAEAAEEIESSEKEDLEKDDDDDEVEDDRGSSHKKRKKAPRYGGFILDEAEVDDDDAEDDEDWEEGAEDIIDKTQASEENTSKDIESNRRLQMMWTSEKEDEIEEYYRKKYAESSAAEKAYGDDGDHKLPKEIAQLALLPSVKDPNLWMVKCRKGKEKATVLHLMRKFIAYQNTDQVLQIRSVVAPESVKGYIYIEAYKQNHVKKAIDGIDNLRLGQYKQTMIAIKEMTDVLRVAKNLNQLKVKQFVRLKRGVFKDDLAQVDFVNLTQNYVHLKLIPRVDYSRKRGNLRSSEQEKRKRAERPPAKLFDVDAVRALGGKVSTDGDFFIFEGSRYSRKGFLYKSFARSSLLRDGIKPTLSELEVFAENRHVGRRMYPLKL